MSNRSTTPSRVSQRLSQARARRRALLADRASAGPARSTLGETLAVGLGCDGWKPRQP